MAHRISVDVEAVGAAALGARRQVETLGQSLERRLAQAADATAAGVRGLSRELLALGAGGRGAEKLAARWAALSAAARPLGESLAALGGRLFEVGAAFGNVLAPAAQALLPAFDLLCDGAIRLLNTLALLSARIFGSGGGLVKSTGAAKSYAASLGGVAKAARAARGELAAFDRLDVLGGATASGGGGGAGSGSGGIEIGEGLVVPDHLLGVLGALYDKARALAAFFAEVFSPAIAAWGAAFEALGEPVAGALDAIRRGLADLWQNGLLPLGRYLLGDFIPSIVNAFSETFAPVFADVAGAVVRQFGLDFAHAAGLVVRVIHDMILPALEGFKQGVTEALASITEMWAVHGAAILAHWEGMREKLRALLDGVYGTLILPMFETLAALLDGLWANHLQPLWHNVVLFFGAMMEAVTAFLDEVLVPFLAWVVETFGPGFVAVVEWLAGVVAAFVGGFVDGVAALFAALRGLMEFLTGIFTGDWQRAWQGLYTFVCGIWQGIQDFIRGIVNGIIAIINGMIGAVVGGINAAVAAINTIRVEIPAWVPGYGGRSIGFDIPTVSAPQIPLLARGAVIPPNRAFLAVLGDQTRGNNLEAPEGLIRQIIREEAAGLCGGDVNIRFTGSLAALARVLRPEIEREARRVGGSLVSGRG